MVISVFHVTHTSYKVCQGWGTIKVHGEFVPLEQPTKDTDEIMVFYGRPSIYKVACWRDIIWEMFDFSTSLDHVLTSNRFVKHWIILGPVPEQRQAQAIREFKELITGHNAEGVG